ncbi:MAG TPA: Ig-like domain repeat protein, partial [Anaerolineales bacterium]|nr:Ig-like domain repeat protein [Anaerolineales bacterium]
MNILKFNTRKSKAQAMVEFAIVLPILLLVVYGLIETGRLIFVVASVNNATRQAVRYGSTSGEGPNGVPRYQDCAGIREAAQKSDFLNAFEDADITITYDQPIPDNPATAGDESQADPPDYNTCNGTVDTGVSAVTGDRVNVTIKSDFTAIFPKFLPFLSRTAAGGNPIVTTSSRTLLLTINVAPPLDPTETLITAHTPHPSQIGDYVTITVLVSGGSTTPTGTVTITGADQNCTITLSGGTGSCSVVRFLSPGTKTITASYDGDPTHDVSGDNKSHTVGKAPTVTTITADTPDPSLAGDTVTVTVTVTSTYGTPTGTVTISGADAPCTITLPGTTSCNVTFAANGKYALSATYIGDAEHRESSDTYERHDVIPKGDTVTIITSHNPNPSEIGKSVTVYVTVGSVTKTPTGTVTITGADTSCTITLNKGAGSCIVVFNSIGVKTLTATYGGAPGLNGSSDSVSHSVELAATTT